MRQCILYFTVALLCAQPGLAQSADELYRACDKAEAAADWPAAEKAARQGMAKYPDQAGFVNWLTYALRMQKKFSEAIGVIESAFRKNPDDASFCDSYTYALLDYGWALNEKEDYAGAAGLFRKAHELKPQDEWVLNAWGYILGKIGRREEGIGILKRACRDFPQNACLRGSLVTLLLEAGWELFEKKDPAGALVFFREAAEIRPDDEWVMNALGCGLRDTGELDAAIFELERGFRMYPQNYYMKGNLIWTYILKAGRLKEKYAVRKPFEKKEIEEIESWYRAAEKIDPTREDYLLNYGIFLYEADRFDEALAMLEKGEKLYPANQYFTPNIQYAYQLKERDLAAKKAYREAIAVIEKARGRFPDEGWFIVDLIDAWFELGEYAKSAETLVFLAVHKNLREYGKPFAFNREDLVRSRLSRLVWKYAERGNHQAGFALIDKIAPGFPGWYFVKEMRGLALYHSGRKEEGIRLVNEAYDDYVAAHPEVRISLSLPLPVKGTFLVWGNNRTDAITHAGLNRFCYDFIGANAAGEILKPGVVFPGSANSDYFGFGAAIYSPVDGVVEDAVDTYEDIKPRAVALLGDGNQLVIRDAQGRHYVFAHLKQGSVTVKPGDVVKAGQKIAELGNNGYTACPHLHFGVYTPDWRISIQVKFQSYKLMEADGKFRMVREGVPQTDDVIAP